MNTTLSDQHISREPPQPTRVDYNNNIVYRSNTYIVVYDVYERSRAPYVCINTTVLQYS